MMWISFSENHFDFSKNFLNLCFNPIEKKSIINLSHNGSKDYALVVLDDSEVTFLGEGKDAAFCPSLYCVLIIYNSALSKGYFIKTGSFSVFNFCCMTLSSS